MLIGRFVNAKRAKEIYLSKNNRKKLHEKNASHVQVFVALIV
jgi:hypothetical protein